jgi:cobalt-zinc-cadmium efflux system membrane fusion protein
LSKLNATAVAAPGPHPKATDAESTTAKTAFDGTISIDDKQLHTLGVDIVEVKGQTEPVKIEVNGKLDYDQDTLTQIHPRFASLVSKVYVQLGQRVKKGQPLVEIFSIELAKAKSEYEKASAQWDRDKKQLVRSQELFKKHAISEKDYLEDVNDERKSRVDVQVARDQVLLYGLSADGIEKVKDESGEQKARVTVRATRDGLVTRRDAVVGTLYQPSDRLLDITPIDHLWVEINVDEQALEKLRVGQEGDVELAGSTEQYRGRLERISDRIDPQTHVAPLRLVIPNPAEVLKEGLYVKVTFKVDAGHSGNQKVPRRSPEPRR